MRIDHHAYQRATRVATFGLLIQLIMGLVLLLFGMIGQDTALRFASIYVLIGSLVWVGLIIIFYQHKLERLEALEEDELSATRGEFASVFDTDPDEIKVAARRLRNMHKWLMPAASLVVVALLAGLGLILFNRMLAVNEDLLTFLITTHRGWAIAISLAVAVLSFIFSRFVAGMAKQKAWQNLRGGAAYMVGNALILVAIAVGLAFAYFDNTTVLRVVAYVIPWFMWILAGEIVFNFLMNLYRPRIAGEVPRAAFDSKLLSLLAAPDSFVRSINEAVNYQFGFDITSSWGYQLLVRSLLALVAIGVTVAILLNMIVVVEPHQQGIKLAGGKIVNDNVYTGVMWKLPWPFETAGVYDVTRVQTIHLTAKEILDRRRITLYSYELNTEGNIQPFIVGTSSLSAEVSDAPAGIESLDAMIEGEDPEIDEGVRELSRNYSLVDAIITLDYRIKSVATGSEEDGLLKYLTFAPDTRRPRDQMTRRQQMLKHLALREITPLIAQHDIDRVLASDRARLSRMFRDRVQAAYDALDSGIEVISVNIANVRPHDRAREAWEDLMMANQDRQLVISQQEGRADQALAALAGTVTAAEDIYRELDVLDALRVEHASDHPEVVAQRVKVHNMLVNSRGQAAQIISRAERDRWVEYMSKRIQALRVRGELAVYQAAPNLYRQREIMRVITQGYRGKRKFLLGIDPANFDFDVELKELESVFQGLSEALDES